MHVGKRGRGIKFGGVIRVHVHVVLVGGYSVHCSYSSTRQCGIR